MIDPEEIRNVTYAFVSKVPKPEKKYAEYSQPDMLIAFHEGVKFAFRMNNWPKDLLTALLKGVDNLEWVTASENQSHAVRTNLKKHGTDLWNGKFTKEQVLEIMRRKHSGESCRKLGKEFGVNETTISAISRGLRYKQYFEEGELQHALRLCGIDKEIVL